MKINQSSVAMASERQASTATITQLVVSERYQERADQSPAATLELSGTAGKGQNQKNLESQLKQMRLNWERQQDVNFGSSSQYEVSTEEDFKIKMLKRLMEALRAFREGRQPDYEKLEREEKQRRHSESAGTGNLLRFDMAASGRQSFSLSFMGAAAASGSSASIVAAPWKEDVRMSTIFADREVTNFSTVGRVKTEDGRDISFNLNLEMSREFISEHSMEYTRKAFCIDPLVINLEGNPASFSDQTFFFDLDSDGKEEELSQLSAGSGFLALDKNGDGKINDGSELFGTKSGDGFADLAAYDEDGNGWIDENDSVFKDLKVWTKGEDGRERLIALGDADVGAIYLGKASTEFSLNRMEDNARQGIIRSTGVFLKESGGVGTIQHVDMVV